MQKKNEELHKQFLIFVFLFRKGRLCQQVYNYLMNNASY